MVLPFIPPLTLHEQAILASLPKLNGSVVNPDYYPRHLKEAGEREYQAWCDRTPAKDWPQWVADWHLRQSILKRAAGGPKP